MATLITPDPNFLAELLDKQACTMPYPLFTKSRVMIPFDNQKYSITCKSFVDKVVTPMREQPGTTEIKIGQYFVFKISDLKTLFDASPEADFVQIHNRLDDIGYHKMVVIPYESAPDGDSTKGHRIIGETTILVEGLPCPPHPSCPPENTIF